MPHGLTPHPDDPDYLLLTHEDGLSEAVPKDATHLIPRLEAIHQNVREQASSMGLTLDHLRAGATFPCYGLYGRDVLTVLGSMEDNDRLRVRWSEGTEGIVLRCQVELFPDYRSVLARRGIIAPQ